MQVHRARDEFESLGARVALIGNGAPRFVANFRRITDYDGELFTDPSRDAYRACGFIRGIGVTLNPSSLVSAVKTFSRGFRQGRTQGDPWQQGGAVIIAPDSSVVTYQRSARAGDHASVSELLSALEAHVAAAS